MITGDYLLQPVNNMQGSEIIIIIIKTGTVVEESSCFTSMRIESVDMQC